MLELTERDRAFFDHLRIYRISTPSLLAPQFCNGSENAMKKLISRLRDYVVADTLGPKNVYYRLTPNAARMLGMPEEASKPLGPQALPKAIGILSFCCSGGGERRRYTRIEFVRDFPDLAREILGREYYLDYYLDNENGATRLGQTIVDLGGDFQRLLSKCRGYLRAGMETPILKDLIADDLFAFGIVVPVPEKKEAIEAALRARPLRASVRVVVSPELNRVLVWSNGATA